MNRNEIIIMVSKRSVLLNAACLALLLGTILPYPSYASTASSSNHSITPFYDYISVVGAILNIGNNGKSISGGFVYYTGNYNSTLKIELQRRDGNRWKTVKSWEESFTGKGHHSLEKEYYVTSGYTYRVLATATIKQGTKVLETATRTSTEVKY